MTSGSEEEPRKVDRGSGVYVAQGGFRIRNLSLSIDATTGELRSSGMTPELRPETFHHWLEISERAAADAEAARAEALDAPLDESRTWGKAMEREFRASMIAVAGAAFAVDAFYAAVVEHAPEARVRSDARAASILETLKVAFTLRRPQQDLLREQLTVIFLLRDRAVHPPAGWVAPVSHPVFNVGVEPRLVHYGMENATQAHRVAHRLIWFCLHRPKRKHKALVSWCEGVTSLVEEPAP